MLIQHPGLGSFHSTDTALLSSLIHIRNNPHRKNKDLPQNSLDEICAVIAAQRGELYADPLKLAADLDWLAQNCFLQPQATTTPLYLIECDRPSTPPHAYSDREPFERLLSDPKVHHTPSSAVASLSEAVFTAYLAAMQAEGISAPSGKRYPA